MTQRQPTTEDQDEEIFDNLRNISRGAGSIGYGFLCGAIDHIRKMRIEINALRVSGESERADPKED